MHRAISREMTSSVAPAAARLLTLSGAVVVNPNPLLCGGDVRNYCRMVHCGSLMAGQSGNFKFSSFFDDREQMNRAK
jgi:hypothetical protein